jgi:UDP-N-acetylglucosamine 2-epimerase
MKKILTVVGARPQFIKAAPVSKALKDTTGYHEVMVHTGQHYDPNMSQTFFDELDMGPPNHNLGVASGSHAYQTGEILKRLEPIVMNEKPDLVLVYGDTNSTLAAAVTASKLCIPIAHVEAGLRSFNRGMPEEVNRVLTDHVATLLFCPTATAVRNLEREGITANVWKTGDVMYDVALQFSAKSNGQSTILADLGLRRKEYILATVHRAENTDNRECLTNIFEALREFTRELNVVLPLHPRTRKMLSVFDIENQLDGIKIIEPVGFLDMIALESNARLIATDSGGLQKEAYFHKVPCVTLRSETEWVETLEANWNVLAAVHSVRGITEMLRGSLAFPGIRSAISDYGDGLASHKIVHELERFFASAKSPICPANVN